YQTRSIPDSPAPVQGQTRAGARHLRAPLEWDPGKDTAFHQLKQALHSAAALQAPDYTTPFHLDVTQRNGNVAATLWQAKAGTRRILLYHSSALPTPALGLPHCARHLMAIAIALRKTQDLVVRLLLA
uniref:Reverse transcriptase/retrotransposon-derived protein RNase H-like domain-containing protein n=1 Tax=Gadus morhua TaxID=8049 RepID=A0A8C5FVQ9_GADMO